MNVKLDIGTPDGIFTAHYSGRGLARLNFPGTSGAADVLEMVHAPVPDSIHRWHETTVAALKDALAGREPSELPPLDLSTGTEFQQRVWNALRKINTGHTRTYQEVAAVIGKPVATRAVGGACGANPIPVFVPCHRVLAAHQRLGGFSGGLDWKRKLLIREGVAFH